MNATVELDPDRPGYDWVGYPVSTDTGPYCGNCSYGQRKIRHLTAQIIRDCYEITAEQEQEQEASWLAEIRAERHLEDRGYWDAIAQENYERAHGVVDFGDAYRAACPWLFEDERAAA